MYKFSNRSLNGLKARYHIKKYKLYKKTRAMDSVVIEEKLQDIWEVIKLYIKENTYNIDNSRLFWKMTLDKSLDMK